MSWYTRQVTKNAVLTPTQTTLSGTCRIAANCRYAFPGIWTSATGAELERFEEVVVGISKPSQVFEIDLLPSQDELERDYAAATAGPDFQDRGEQVYRHERRQSYRSRIAEYWGTDWEHVKSQVETALQRRADCLGQG